MDSVKYIFDKPEIVKGVGEVYSIQLNDYDTFVEIVGILQISKKHIPEEEKDKFTSVFDYIVAHGLNEPELVINLERMFSLLTRKKFRFTIDEQTFGFISEDEESIVVRENYDEFRKIAMKQNLLFEKKVFKDKLTQQWADRVLEARQKNSIKMSIEDMISTVSVYCGITYKDLSEYTLYQLNQSFSRISKFKEYETNVSFKCAGAEKIALEHYAEEINLFKDPYEDLFKSKSKLSNINKALGNG